MKFGKYAIKNLTLVLIMFYVAGYILMWTAPDYLNYLTLDTHAIIHGQVWRLITWLIIPPSSFDIFTIIMLFFYWSLGTQLERVWGVWRYNVYIFTGILMTILGAFAIMAGMYLFYPGLKDVPEYVEAIFGNGALFYSTYYVNMSIFLAYAFTFPDNQVLLMFLIPVRIKWLGIIYGIMLGVDLFSAAWSAVADSNPFKFMYWFQVVAIGASLLNFLVFFLRSRSHIHLNPKQIRRRAEFRQDIRKNPRVSRHKCAICGRTDEDDPTLEFRFCSKCNGNYEYCQEHLFTHEHIK